MKKTKRGLPDMEWLPNKELWRKRGVYRGQHYEFTAKSPETVLEKVKIFEGRIDNAHTVTEGATVWSFIQRWYPLRTAGLKQKTVYTSYDIPINNYIIPKIGNLPIGDVKPLHIDELMSSIADKSFSFNHKVLVTLKQIFRSAIENDYITKDPCNTGNGGRRKAGGVKQKKKKPLTRAQQNELAAAVRGERPELFVLLCLYAGLRREEALGLLWQNVHLDGETPYIDIRHATTTDVSGAALHSDALKSNAAYRTIPLPQRLAEALARRKPEATSVFVVPTPSTGQAMSGGSFTRLWNLVAGYSYKRRGKDGKLLLKDGKHVIKDVRGFVTFPVTPHILRHTYITELCLSGMDIKKIQYLAGHESAIMTLDIYADVANNTPSELITIINRHFLEGSREGSREESQNTATA